MQALPSERTHGELFTFSDSCQPRGPTVKKLLASPKYHPEISGEGVEYGF